MGAPSLAAGVHEARAADLSQWVKVEVAPDSIITTTMVPELPLTDSLLSLALGVAVGMGLILLIIVPVFPTALSTEIGLIVRLNAGGCFLANRI